MDTKLDCAIVRDLLPSYADGLTSEETNRAVDAHLKDCEGCSEILRLMKAPEHRDVPPAAEVDYLKKVRRRAGRTAILYAAGAAFLILALLFIRLFVFGNEAGPSTANYSTSVSGNTVYVSGSLTDRGSGVSRVAFTEKNGVVSVRVSVSPKAFFNSSEFSGRYTAKGAVTEIRFSGLIVWEKGQSISRTAAQLYAAKNPYVGDMSANGEIAGILGISDQLGAYTNELQTSSEPYGWALLLSTPIAAKEETAARDIMTADSYVMLAAVGNLGYVTWKYDTESGSRDFTVQAKEATAFAGRDIKSCAGTVSDLQALLQSLSIKWSGVRETPQEDGTFRLSVANRSSADLYGITINYYLNGMLIGSRTSRNADGSALGDGTAEFEFVPDDFPAGTGAVGLSGFSFDLAVLDKDGKQKPVCKGMNVTAKYAWTFYFSLTGSYADGFTLNEG